MRVADKSERICITDVPQRRALLQQSISYCFQTNQILQATAAHLKGQMNNDLGLFVTQNISTVVTKINEL